MWKSEFRQNYYRTSFSPTVPPFAARISRVVADGGTWRLKWERLKAGGKQWQTITKNFPRMQCARAIPVTWLGSDSCQARPSRLNTNDWIITTAIGRHSICSLLLLLFLLLLKKRLRSTPYTDVGSQDTDTLLSAEWPTVATCWNVQTVLWRFEWWLIKELQAVKWR